ncbi:MAG TPA: hypothetical protein VNN23_10660 [Ornithinibacter sp.]|nr:hypothetical protein [Ornithinibacter sp.]
MTTERERALEDAAKKKQAAIDSAVEAEPDTEEALVRLRAMMLARRKDPVADAAYEQLRDALTAQLKAEGSRYFINDEGVKQYAYSTNPESVEVDPAAIIALHDAGEIDDEVFEKVLPRQVDKEALRGAIARGANPRSRKPGIAPAQVAQIARIVPKTAYVVFVDAETDERE